MPSRLSWFPIFTRKIARRRLEWRCYSSRLITYRTKYIFEFSPRLPTIVSPRYRNFSHLPQTEVPSTPVEQSPNDVEDKDLLFLDSEDIAPNQPLEQESSFMSLLDSLQIDAPQKQTQEKAQRMFDLMAPHLTFDEIMQIQHKMKKFRNSKKYSMDQYVTLTGQINAVFHHDDILPTQSIKTSTQKKYHLNSEKPINPWIPSLISLFFANTTEESWNTLPNTIVDHPTFPTKINRQEWDKNVQLWIRVRQLSKLETLNVRSEEIIQHERHIHSFETREQDQKDAEYVASLLADRLPTEIHRRIMELVSRWSMDVTMNININSTSNKGESIHANEKMEGPKRIPFLQNLKTCANLHAPLILQDLTDYLYGDKEKDQTLSSTDSAKNPIQHSSVPSWKRWNRLRNNLSSILVSAQHSYVDHCETVKKQKELDTDEDFLNTRIPHTETDNRRKLSSRERKESKKFISFNTLILQDNIIQPNLAPLLNDHHRFVPVPENILFLDNLPIDISEEELQILYSRCGDLESIRIFNRKPDLDPGERTKSQQKMLLKSSRLSGLKATNRRVRQKSPVYAMLQFKETMGYNTATIDALRIFGMICRSHAVRSIPAHNMTRLYIENIPSGHRTSVFENKLCEALFPFMRVYLDLGVNPVKDVRNCEIRFPSFDSCYHAFSLLSNGQDDPIVRSDNIQWFKTPINAMDYWTRSIVIEP